MHEAARPVWRIASLSLVSPHSYRHLRDNNKMRAVIAFLALTGAAAFAPAPAQRSATALNAQKPA